jgi:hypothetical protein
VNPNEADEVFTNPDGPDVIVVSAGVTGGGGAGPFTTAFPAAEQFSFCENRWSWLFTSRHTNRAYVPADAVAGTWALNLSFLDFPAANAATGTR